MGLSEREQRVCEAIAARRSALLDDLRLHVELPTGGRNAAALDRTRELFTERARRLGARVDIAPGQPAPRWLYGSPGYGERDTDGRSEPPPTAICRREDVADRGSRRPLLIAGHLDTVHDPAGPFQKLTLSPDGKRGVGPGCVDMKGGLVIAMAALECLDECGVRLPWTLLFNSDEETGSYNSQQAIFDEAARVAKAGGVGIAIEPGAKGSEGALAVERAGSGQFFIEVSGKAAHVGREFAAGVSAVNALASIILDIARMSDPAHDLIVSIGPIEGGTATNIVPDRARAWGNLRFPTRQRGEQLATKLRATADAAQMHGVTVRLESSLIREAKPLTPQVQALADLARAASLDLGRELPFTKTAGVCDGNIMQAAGLPTLDTLGVRGGGLHTPEEWIEIDSLVERCQLLAVFMMRAGRAD
jgi:glutamate carboxypeptidase